MSHDLALCSNFANRMYVRAFEKDLVALEYVSVCAIVLLTVQAKACPRHGGQLGV